MSSVIVRLDSATWGAFRRWADTMGATVTYAGTAQDATRCWHVRDTKYVPSADLTTRERQVLLALTQGMANQDIADDLVLGVETVRTHVKRLFRKLGARDRAHAVHLGYQSGALGHRPMATGAGEQASPSAGHQAGGDPA